MYEKVLVIFILCGLFCDGTCMLRLLRCHSVNRISGNKVTEFVFIPTRKEDCAFLFEGPEGSRLEMEVKSISFPGLATRVADREGCNASRLVLYNYIHDKITLAKFLCREEEKASVVTESNMGLITTKLTSGTFSLRVAAVPTSPGPVRREPAAGMLPPLSEAVDFFKADPEAGLEADAETVGGFRPVEGSRPVEGFRPSRPAPVYSAPQASLGLHFYPGRPTETFDLTYNSTGHNFTIVSSTLKPPVDLTTLSPVTSEKLSSTTAKPAADTTKIAFVN